MHKTGLGLGGHGGGLYNCIIHKYRYRWDGEVILLQLIYQTFASSWQHSMPIENYAIVVSIEAALAAFFQVS